MDDDGKRCMRIKKKMVCFDESSSSFSFDESYKYFVSTVDDLKSSNPFHMVNKCMIQGSECFSRNLKIGVGFFIIYLAAGLVINFLHELVHYTLLVSIGITGTSFTFAPNVGFTTGDFPPFDSSIHWTWWFFETMGPLLIVNFTMIIIALLIVNHDVKNPPYNDSTLFQKLNWARINFLKAIAFTSAMAILVNTIFSPFYNMYYVLIGIGERTSDLSWAWSIALQLPSPGGIYMQAMIYATVSVMIMITITFAFLFNRRETGR